MGFRLFLYNEGMFRPAPVITAIGAFALAAVLIAGTAALLFHKQVGSAIEEGARYYSSEHIAGLRIDDALLYRLIARSGRIPSPDPMSDFAARFRNDPARRLLDWHDAVTDLSLERNLRAADAPPLIDNSFYTVHPPYRQALRDPYDDILFKAISCDQTGYDSDDFAILRSIGSSRGDSADTHLLFGLLLLRGNGCFAGVALDQEISAVAERIVTAASEDAIFGDLYAERIVFLYWAGYGDRIRPWWIWRIVRSLELDGWRDGNDIAANAHTTGLALLALIYFEDGKTEQRFYPFGGK